VTQPSEGIRNATQALTRFFAFFCALTITIAIVVTITLWVRPSTISDGSTAVAVFGLTSLVLFILMVASAITSGVVARTHAAGEAGGT
jgi:hypothetical protein